MGPRQVVLILLARYKVALFVALITFIGGVTGGVVVPKRYVAETAVMVDVRSPDPISAVLLPATNFPGSLATQTDIITSNRVARKVVKILQLESYAAVKDQWLESTGGKVKLDDWLVSRLPSGLKVSPSRDSNIIKIAFTGTDPRFVAAIANAYVQAYIEAAIEMKVEPARQYARWFGDQAKILRENVEFAQGKLSGYQREKGIVASDDTDHETAKLNELSARLTAIQSETRDAQSRQRSSSGVLHSLPEVQQNTVIANLRTSVAQLESRLKEAAGNLGINHPQYKRMETELAELKIRLEQETRLITSGYSSTTSIGKAREVELIAAIEAQKKYLLQLKDSRDEIAVLKRDVDTAKRAYEAVTNRFTQTSLESQATQTNISVLTPATEPVEPSFPKPLRTMILMSVVAAILLGGAAAFGLEILDRRVRSTEDLEEMLQLPVLGTVSSSGGSKRLGFLRGRPALTLK